MAPRRWVSIPGGSRRCSSVVYELIIRLHVFPARSSRSPIRWRPNTTTRAHHGRHDLREDLTHAVLELQRHEGLGHLVLDLRALRARLFGDLFEAHGALREAFEHRLECALPSCRPLSDRARRPARSVAPIFVSASLTAPTFWVMRLPVSRAAVERLRTSCATTANPWPAVPACAASMAAFNASMFVWKAMDSTSLAILRSSSV